MPSRDEIYEALATVHDTCSLFNGTNLNIVEMGLIHDVDRDGGTVRVRLLLTDPMCLYVFEMRAQIVEALTRLDGIDSVDVAPVAGKLWWPERMSSPARARLEHRRRARAKELGLQPAHPDNAGAP
jgi:metal-sulfur cluster biosynthetic enzyme